MNISLKKKPVVGKLYGKWLVLKHEGCTSKQLIEAWRIAMANNEVEDERSRRKFVDKEECVRR